jgi:tRNA threonylcarbamoyladenosine biosynthesis protein TsaB
MSDNIYIMGVDVSSNIASCTILKDDVEKTTISKKSSNGHSSTLLPMIINSLDEFSITLDALKLISVCIGPGQFTGIRIGVGTVLGLSKIDDIPIIGVSSLQARAILSPVSTKIPVNILIYARKNEAYLQTFTWVIKENRYIPLETTPPKVLKITDIFPEHNSSTFFVDKRIDFPENIIEKLENKMSFFDINTPPLSVGVAQIGYYNYLHPGILPVQKDKLEPLYIRTGQVQKN